MGNQLDFNALMDGRTGLTPTNILTPIMVNMTTSSSSSSSSSGLLQTPTVSTPSCGSQQRTNRSTVLQELGSPNTGGHLYLCDVQPPTSPLTPGSELEFKWKIMTPSPYVDYYYI